MTPILIKQNGETLQSQLYGILRKKILSGELSGGMTLPGSRALAAELALSRNTVNAVYARLEGEGYLRIHPSSGARVREGLKTPAPVPEVYPAGEDVTAGFPERRRDIIDFRSGIPSLSDFPVARWGRILKQILAEASPDTFGYGPPEGRQELREAVAGYAARHRGAVVRPESVLITAGTTQAVGLLTRLLLLPEGPDGPRLTCAVEEPLTADIKSIIRGLGGRVLAVPVDRSGFPPAAIPPGVTPAALYVTPSHQFPLGMVMPLDRRLELVEYARSRNCWIIEDDYDSEFRHEGTPLPSLQGLAPDRTLYIGTFSKTLSPALRTAYLIMPPGLISRGRQLKWFTDLHNPTLDQLALARFVGDGHYGRHIAALRRKYRRNREVLVSALDDAARTTGLMPKPEILGEAAGIHLAVRFPGVRFDGTLPAALERAGVKVYPVSEHAENPGLWSDTVILGFGSLDHDDLRNGAGILVKTVTKVTDKKNTTNYIQ